MQFLQRFLQEDLSLNKPITTPWMKGKSVTGEYR